MHKHVKYEKDNVYDHIKVILEVQVDFKNLNFDK